MLHLDWIVVACNQPLVGFDVLALFVVFLPIY